MAKLTCVRATTTMPLHLLSDEGRGTSLRSSSFRIEACRHNKSQYPWCLSACGERSSGVPAQVCTVFAQLSVRGVYQGPHVFVVRLRDDAGQPMRGVRIQDNGPKVGPLIFWLNYHRTGSSIAASMAWLTGGGGGTLAVFV